MATVTLAIIAKDEYGNLKRILTDYSKYFDSVQVAIDLPNAELEKEFPSVEFIHYEWKHDFSDKRNLLAGKCKTDFYFTIDTDDAIDHPELIKEVAKEALSKDLNVVYGFYVYSVDEDGNPNAAHWKERLVRNNGRMTWNKRIHENLLPDTTVNHKWEMDGRLSVKHLIDHDHGIKSNERNLKYLIAEYEQDKDKTDPRTIAYLGRVLFGLGDFKAARFFLEKHIALSGWDEDRHLSWCQLSTLHRLTKNYEQAIACAFEALQERPELPDAYLELHNIYFDQEKWTKAIEWGAEGIKKEQPKNFMVLDPSSYTWRPALTLSWCYFNLGDYEQAKKLFDYAKKLAPSVPFIKENEKIYTEAVERYRYLDKLMWMIEFLKEKGEAFIVKLIESIPEDLHTHQTVALLRNRYLPPKRWSDKSVVIYCGETPEMWSPKSVDGGIGGSEEAVIHLSNELTKLGYEVTVFNHCGQDEGKYDGVNYVNYVRFNPKDAYNIIVGWRVNLFTFGVQGRNKIVWLHDIPWEKVSDDEVKAFDKVVVLSKYHASLLPKNIPEEKIYISTNGLNPADFVGIAEKREPHRIIYASSYDRGLELILENWKQIRESVPDAELHCFYGFNTYDAYARKGLLKDDGWKAKMLELFKQDGVFEHGRVGHKELLKEYAKSAVLAYPCKYKGEINCIALSKAIACGCFPLTNDFAVMAERNTHGRVVTNDKFISSLITLLRKGNTQINNDGYLEANSWSAVARDWSDNLFPTEVETLVEGRLDWTWRNLSRTEKIIDIGCNKGHVFYGWDRKNITSVDIDKYDFEGFVQASADNLPFPDKSFDCAVLAEIVEHTKNPIDVLREAGRVAKRCLITVPYEYEWPEQFEPFKKLEDKKRQSGDSFVKEIKEANDKALEIKSDDGYAHLFHETFYTPDLLRDHLTQAGFKSFKIVKLRRGRWVWLGAICE